MTAKAYMGSNGLWYVAYERKDGSHRSPGNGIYETAAEAMRAHDEAESAAEEWDRYHGVEEDDDIRAVTYPTI